MKMKESYLLSKNFVIANQCFDLIKIIMDLAKPRDKKTTFPKALYGTYVNEMRQCSLDIYRNICLANKTRNSTQRVGYIEVSLGIIIELANLVFYAYEKRWISEKKHDSIQILLTSIYSKSDAWQKKYI